MKKQILVTGGDGRFAKVLRQNNKKLNLFFTSKSQCNILNLNSIIKIVKKILFFCIIKIDLTTLKGEKVS